MLLAACGSGSDGGTAALANLAPTFSSSANVSVQENSGGPVYTVTASDPEGAAVTVSLGSGGDAAAFSFDPATGALSFASPPDFENPGDADGDNVYNVSFTARDPSGASATLNVAITVTDDAGAARLARVGQGFSQPLYLTALPDGSGRVAVVEKGGRVRLLNPETGAVDTVDFLDVSGDISTNGERGLLGLAFSPDFETDGVIYINITNPAGNTEIRRYSTFAGSLEQIDPSTADIIMAIGQPADNHNSGWLGFDDAGFLVIPTGDGGGAPGDRPQDLNNLLGKVLRIDVNGDDFPADDDRDYAIPAGNPLAMSGGAPEIVAAGLRNPFRCSFDPDTGDLLIGDVGQSAIEEIDRLEFGGGLVNFGWPLREGTQSFNGGANRPEFTAPVAEYGHGSGERQGRSVTGGYLYRGPVEALQGDYVFADFITSNIWSVPGADLVNGETVASGDFEVLNAELTPDAGSLGNIPSFGEDADGDLYILSFSGDVFRVEAGN